MKTQGNFGLVFSYGIIKVFRYPEQILIKIDDCRIFGLPWDIVEKLVTAIDVDSE